MRFSFQSGVRNDLLQEIADQTFSPVKGRNGKTLVFGYNQNVAPHGNTQRISYTVPAGKYAYIRSISLGVTRMQMGGLVGVPTITYWFTPAGGAVIDLHWLPGFNQAVGDRKTLTPSDGFIMHAGDFLEVVTFDSGSGGSNFFNTGFIANEFDS